MKEEEAGDLPFTTAKLSRLGFDPNLSKIFEHDLRRQRSQLSAHSDWSVRLVQPSDWLIVTLVQPSDWSVRLVQPFDWLIVTLVQPSDWLIVTLVQPSEWLIVTLVQPSDWLIVTLVQPSDWLTLRQLSSLYRKRSESATAPVRLMLVLARLCPGVNILPKYGLRVGILR